MPGRARSGFERSSFSPRIKKGSGKYGGSPIPPSRGLTIAMPPVTSGLAARRAAQDVLVLGAGCQLGLWTNDQRQTLNEEPGTSFGTTRRNQLDRLDLQFG